MREAWELRAEPTKRALPHSSCLTCLMSHEDLWQVCVRAVCGVQRSVGGGVSRERVA